MSEENKIFDAEVVDTNVSNLPALRTVSNSTGQEIVKYDQNGAIVSCQYGRVDFNTPATILTYCEDIQEEISAIFDNTAQLATDTKEVLVDDNMLANITSFEKSLDESEKEAEKEAKKPAIIKKIRGLLSRAGVKSFEEKTEEETTYKGRYARYCENLEDVSAAVESQKQAALVDINIRNATIQELVPYIEILEEMIRVGEIDKATFDASIEELKKLPQDQDTLYEIQFKTQLSGVFNGKLSRLGKALIVYKEQIQNYRLQNNTEMQIVMESDSYLRDIAPILKVKGSEVVFNRQQENRLTSLTKLTEAANTALITSAKDAEANAQMAVDLSLNGGITLETLKEVNDAVKRGFTIVQNGRKQLQQVIAQEKQGIQELSASIDTYQQELLNLVDDESVREALLKESNSGPVRRLGTGRKGRK